MVALKPNEIAGLLKKRNPQFQAILLYGNDAGAVRERSDILARQVVPDLTDAFNFIELTEGDLKEEKGRLVDEAAALSFMGGERVIRLRGSSTTITEAVKNLFGAIDAKTFTPNAVTIVEASGIKKTSGLYKLFAKPAYAAALACYEDNAKDIRQMVTHALNAEDLTITDEALSLLCINLGADRGISRSELEKLILYMGPKSIRTQPAQVTLEDVQHCLTDSVDDAMFAITDFVASGNPHALSKAMVAAQAAGSSALGWMRLLERQFNRLYTARLMMDQGMSSGDACKKLRPPVFYPQSIAFESQLKKWSRPQLEQAITMLTETELSAKSTGAPATELIERTALRLSVMALR